MRFLVALLMALICERTFAQQSSTNDSPVRFHAMDIYVDSKDKPLAAYQLEFSITNSDTKIVGIEGGDHPAFAEPPFYDPKAMQHERVIIAAFNTSSPDHLPTGRTRVATIHFQTRGTARPEYVLKVQAAADSTGTKISVESSIEERKRNEN